MRNNEDIEPFDPEWLVRRGVYFTEIDPELAAELLKRNHENRNPKPRKIEQFVREMQRGAWDIDVSDIKFGRNGDLVDGQNRLLACIEAKVPFPTMIRTCVNPGAKAKVDTGSARTAADALKMEGISGGSPSAVAAAVNLRSRFIERITEHDGKRGFDYKSITYTHGEVIEYLRAHPAVTTWASRAENLSSKVVPAIPRSVCIAALSMFAEVDEANTVRFYDALVHGSWGGPGDPLMALIGYAARIRGGRVSGSPGARGRVQQEENLMALIKTWNAWRTGEHIKLLSIRQNERLELPL